MLSRQKFPKQKDLLLIADYPIKMEESYGRIWSATSHVTFQEDLLQEGVDHTNYSCTYLSYSRPEQDNYDFNKCFAKKNQLEPSGKDYTLGGYKFHQLEKDQDLWIREDLYEEYLALLAQIKQVQPKLIVLIGKWSLFFLTRVVTVAQTRSVTKTPRPFGGLPTYRASNLTPFSSTGLTGILIIPSYPSIIAYREPAKLPIYKWDIGKIGITFKKLISGVPITDFLPAKKKVYYSDRFEVCKNRLETLLRVINSKATWVAVDVETRHYSIDCIGFCYEKDFAFTVPFSSYSDPSLHTLEEEVYLVGIIAKVLKHKNCKIIGQNYFYDQSHISYAWLIASYSYRDTMVTNHVIYNFLPKSLDFLASIYVNQYAYWKGMSDHTKIPITTDRVDLLDEKRWRYNGLDCIYTYEIALEQEKLLETLPEKLQDFQSFQQTELSPAISRVMARGVRVDLEQKEKLYIQLSHLKVDVEKKLSWLIGEEFNSNSNPQIKAVFTDLLQIKPIADKKTKAVSFNSEAIAEYIKKYPIFRTFLTLLLEYRSLKVYVNTFLKAQVDPDGYIRCSYNISGTTTYRLASRKNAFGAGMNLMNIPKKGKISLDYSTEEIQLTDTDVLQPSILDDIDIYNITELPNCKKIFIPGKGYTFFDVDLSGADAMVVAMDSGCAWLLDFFRTQTKKLYIYIGEEYLQEDMTTEHPMYKKFKQFIHGTNYLLGYEQASVHAGISKLEAKRLQEFYFRLCPEIKEWHNRIKSEVKTRGYVENVFGARGYFLNRNDRTLLNKAVAYIPQSTIAILINKGLVNIDKYETTIQVQMQVHDSLAGQFISTDIGAPERIKRHLELLLPYKDSIIIPAEVNTSIKSYGDI